MLQAPDDHKLPKDRLVPPPGYYETMETAIRELLLEKGIFTAEELNREVQGASGSGKRTLVNQFISDIYNNNKEFIKNYVMYVNCAHGKGLTDG